MTVSAEAGCTAPSAHEAACRVPTDGGRPQAVVRLGDLADTVTVAGPFPSRRRSTAGPATTGWPGADEPDRLTGGEGRDALLGGGGDDTLVATEQNAVADSYDGGAGRDVVSFTERRTGVTATLSRPGLGEGDAFAAVEDLIGGAGDDRLTGDAGANLLTGSSGSDRLDGGPGPDSLRGGPGRDEIRGGSGDDEISGDPYARDGDRVFCGPGVDTILDVHRADLLARDCERVDLGVFVRARRRCARIRWRFATAAPASRSRARRDAVAAAASCCGGPVRAAVAPGAPSRRGDAGGSWSRSRCPAAARSCASASRWCAAATASAGGSATR